MNLIAIDDEPLALSVLEKHCRLVPAVRLLGTFTNVFAAVEFMAQNPVDLLLTDINMPDLNGISLVKSLAPPLPMVIFTTAHREFALEGYELDVVDFLVKPISPERFSKALQKAQELHDLRQRPFARAMADDFFFVRVEYQQVKIHIREILFVEGLKDYVKIHIAGQTRPVVTMARLKSLEERLVAHRFVRIHRSFLVNLERVSVAQKSRVKIGERWLPVGETHGAAFRELLDEA